MAQGSGRCRRVPETSKCANIEGKQILGMGGERLMSFMLNERQSACGMLCGVVGHELEVVIGLEGTLRWRNGRNGCTELLLSLSCETSRCWAWEVND
jgi:hypothetical protein